jgi:hypothetical protein
MSLFNANHLQVWNNLPFVTVKYSQNEHPIIFTCLKEMVVAVFDRHFFSPVAFEAFGVAQASAREVARSNSMA